MKITEININPNAQIELNKKHQIDKNWWEFDIFKFRNQNISKAFTSLTLTEEGDYYFHIQTNTIHSKDWKIIDNLVNYFKQKTSLVTIEKDEIWKSSDIELIREITIFIKKNKINYVIKGDIHNLNEIKIISSLSKLELYRIGTKKFTVKGEYKDSLIVYIYKHSMGDPLRIGVNLIAFGEKTISYVRKLQNIYKDNNINIIHDYEWIEDHVDIKNNNKIISRSNVSIMLDLSKEEFNKYFTIKRKKLDEIKIKFSRIPVKYKGHNDMNSHLYEFTFGGRNYNLEVNYYDGKPYVDIYFGGIFTNQDPLIKFLNSKNITYNTNSSLLLGTQELLDVFYKKGKN